ncbi:MAG: DUF1549 domain-containing protein [Isosphaeraceae bacterium]
MNATLRRPAFLASLALFSAVSLATAGTVDDRFFREKVEPVLASKCYQCHSGQAKSVKAGLRLDTREGLLKGGDSGPAVVPGKSAESLLVQAVRHEEGMAMPPKSPRLSEAVIADLAAWVDAGAPDLRQPAASAGQDDPKRHWAFQPVRAVTPPSVKNSDWPKNPVDAFVLAKLEERGWKPSPEASRADWIRRVTFDLTGLPPTPEEIAAFEADRSALAYETVVDRLLAGTHYGERWAQHWLDVVRFAESEGYEYDRHVPDAWRFRDYVVDALNHDKPFDRFVLEQIAGDEVGPNDPECLTASAFHRLGPVRRNAGDAEIALSRNEVLTERTDVIGAAFLGLTVGCARCHNHKLEPIAQKDYYRLQAYLAATDEHNVSLANPDQVASWEATTKRIKAEMEALKTRARKLSGKERVALSARIEALEDTLPPTPATIPATWNSTKDRTEIHVLKRGEWAKKGEKVGPRPLGVLVPEETPELPADVPDPRTRLARWLTDPSHPLTPRVIANRLWQHHFGVGIVKTVNDFGTKGTAPATLSCSTGWPGRSSTTAGGPGRCTGRSC